MDQGLVLSLIMFLPLVGALVVGLIPRAQEELYKWAALLTAIVVFILSVIVAWQFDYSDSSIYQFGTTLPWIESIGSSYHIGLDGISLPMLVLSTFVTVLAIVYSWNHWEEPRNPKSVPHSDPHARNGHERHLLPLSTSSCSSSSSSWCCCRCTS